jgi:DNA-binding transcriptional MerR regulator
VEDVNVNPDTIKVGNHTPRVRPPTRGYRIGDVVRHTPLSRQTIHNYTIMGLIHEVEWTQGGHRLYDESVFDRLSRIMTMRKTKTLSQIRDILRQEEPRTPRDEAT